MLNGRLRSAVIVAGLGLGWTFMAPQAATAQCTYYLSASTVDNVSDAGASGSLSVAWSQPPLPLDVDLLCGDSWVAGSNVNWISLRTSLTNNAILYYTVDANPTTSARTGTITVSGETVTIEQLTGCPSSPQVSPTSLRFTSAGGSKNVTVQEAAHCRYAVSDNQPWISVPTTVAGNGRVRVTVPSYDGTRPGFGTVTIGTQGVPVRQDPRPIEPNLCDAPPSPTVTPSSLSFDSATGSKTVRLSGSAGCSHPVSADQTWITVPLTASDGDLMTVSVTGNTSTQIRSGTVTIRGTSMQVTQVGRHVPPLENKFPVAVDDSVTTQMNTPVAISVLANDTDADNDSLTVEAVVRAPAQGTAVVDTGGQTITYTPPTNWTGMTTFTYRVTDGSTGRAVATVTVTVTPVNRPPTANAGVTQTVAVGDTVTLEGGASADPDGDSLTYQWTQTSGPNVVLFNVSLFYETSTDRQVAFRAPAPVADANLEFSLVVTDARGSASEPATVTVAVLGAVLTQHRERLLADLASRGGRTGGVCALWNSLNRTTKEVFLWNTHRLHITGMLPDVTKLYAVYGRGGCGGIEHNRTFMAMTPALRDKLVLIARDQNRTVLPKWRETRDLACTWAAQLVAIISGTIFRPECPHYPFTAQIETFGGEPRGQIQFFGPDYVVVSREYGPGGGFDSCGVDRIGVPRSDVCPAGMTCSGGGPYTGCTSEHSDTIVYDPTGPYTRGPAGDTVTITDALSFEMDQDYGTTHNSAPGCSNMRMTYSEEYGDPNWQWRPTGCSPPMGVTEPEPDPFGGRSIRAVHMTELRQRVNALRQRFSLAAYNWTDATITPEVTPAKAVHVTELRTALNEAYRAANRDAPDFTDAVITPRVTPIRQVHLNELRKAVVALER